MKLTLFARDLLSGLAVLSLVVLSARGAETPSPWQPVACIPSDLPPEAMFEVMQPVDDFEAAAVKWSLAVGGQHAKAAVQRDAGEHHSGGAALRVDYDFVGKRDYEYIQLNGAATFERPGLGFGFWFKGDGKPFQLRLRFIDASGEWHQTDLFDSDQPGWQFIAGALDAHSTAWGGDGNRRKDYPCKLAGICVDRPQVGFVAKGSLWIDDAAIVQPSKSLSRPLKVQVEGRRFGNLYAVGDTVKLRVSGNGDRLRWRTTDFFGGELAQGDGPAAGTEAAFPLKQPGWFSCKVELVAGGQVVGTEFFPCAALPGGRETVASDFLGMCSHFGQNAYPLETMELMRRYGIDQFRDEVLWTHCESEKGRVVVPPFCAKYLQRAAELRMRPLIIYDYHNKFYDNGGFPNSPEAIAAFARYAVELTRQTRGQVNMFEVWNEWVGGCGMTGRPGKHDGEAYGRLLKPVYEAVKREFPEVTVVGIGGEYGPNCADNILGAIRTAGPAAMDAWSIHPYRYPRPPESSDLVGEVRGIAAKAADAGVKTKAWITEIGYPTHRTSGGSDLAAQARHAVRTLALLQSRPEVGRAFWYDFKDDGVAREYNEANFGVVHHQNFNCAPKPAIVAMAVFNRLTSGAKPMGLTRNGDVFVAAYRLENQSDVLLAWTTRGERSLTVEGKLKAAFDLMGRTLPQGKTAQLSEAPVYLTGEKLALP